MTEQEWLKCTDPTPMFEFLSGKASDRRLRLFACACCRSVWQWLPDESQSAVEIAELYADDAALRTEFGVARENALRAIEYAAGDSESGDLGRTKWHATSAVVHCTEPSFRVDIARDASQEARQAESCHQFETANPGIEVPFPEPDTSDAFPHAEILHDIFGNSFHPIAIDPRWLTSNVVDLARFIYDERAYDRMPILADALMDAGCDSEEIIAHCRGTEGHVRGCWVVDLLTGRE